VNMVMNLRVPYNAGKFLSSFSRRAQLHEWVSEYQNINYFQRTCKWSGSKDWLTRQLQDSYLWMKRRRRRRSRKSDVQPLCMSGIFISMKHKKVTIMPTSHSVFHYWIVIVALCNADFTPRFLCVCFVYSLVMGL
jgi:hypothetical protein